LRARQSVDGVILHGPRRDDPRLPLLAGLQIPFVVHGRATGTQTPYSWVDVNNKRAILRATQFLMDLGHRRIGLINGREDMDFALRRRAGYVEALSLAGQDADPALMHSAEMSETEGHRAARAMLALPQPPTALVVSSIVSAIGVRRAADEMGLVLGRDLSVVAYDDDISYLRNGDEVPLFTAMRSSVRDAGRRAARMLIDLIEHPASAPRSEMLEATLHLGLSTGPAPRA
jgi:LacI family transcriptional regulator